jgi:hypothetical protein
VVKNSAESKFDPEVCSFRNPVGETKKRLFAKQIDQTRENSNAAQVSNHDGRYGCADRRPRILSILPLLRAISRRWSRRFKLRGW